VTGTAWVIGGTGGIGGACTRGLAEDGFTVHTSDRPAEDITQPGVATTIAERLAAAGPITAAVHTIGMSGRRYGDGPPSECTDSGWDEVLRVDLTSAFYFVRACLNYCAPGSSVVLIGSALAKGLDGDFLTVAYRVAKAGMIPLLEAAAYEGARKGIRFNLVAPGLVETPMAARALGNEAIIARFPELMPLTRRPATADEVAAAVRWLTSAAAAQTTGAVIPVDGGWLLR
jgi:NAD(P)-dependent dehydrogenase (short-subunit alcohol dehydrogenase family)